MPGLVKDTALETITVRELHPTFLAEVEGVNFPAISDEQFSEIVNAMAKYGACVFRSTGLSDEKHVEFSRRFGDLDNIARYLTGGRKPRYELLELFDAGNIENGAVVAKDSVRGHYNRGNALWHVDSSFNPRRASFSLLRAVELPPPGTGGETYFADSRTAFEELPDDLRKELLEHDYVGAHTIVHSRKLGSPEYFKDLDASTSQMYRHRIVQLHEPSGRNNLYIGTHMHHIEDASHPGIAVPNSAELIERLLRHVTQSKYTRSVEWNQPGDMIIWDNRCVLHRASGGSFEGKFKRDVRRTTVHDNSPTAWGLNSVDSEWQGFQRTS
ncbi:hypothetical protein JX266_007593 [Neoarthrinium moseri]|uniref:uncharacterized protein n=1 Tax=Neoarthrinium moseri TaxID=1658444 RepID=UPI001FDDD301|nr:uncharacterized protein JN550_008913 [Neoarthrinium moseri]KAI1846388.1 hypothetical protein JX266_007593 [Neoarthrinium moseri]KAI1864356.1 hypothetical protein JN550_008913 [Neoarthrinium moseri]